MITALETPIPDDVLAFLDDTVSRRGRRHWQWKYGRGTADAPAAFYWRAADGRVLGFIGLMRTALHSDGGVHPAAWFVDWYVAPGQPGIGMGLLRRAEAAAGMLLTLQGSADTRQILPRLGWKESAAAVTWVRPLSRRFIAGWLARRLPAPLARLTAPLAALALRPRRAPRPPGAELVAAARLPSSYDATGARRAAEATAMRRDSEYLNWLCADYPDGGYALWLARRDGADVGHLVTRCDDDRQRRRRGRIVDAAWPWDDAALGAWIVGEAVRALRAAGADYVECLSSSAPLAGALAGNGFRRRAAVPLWFHRLPAGVPAAEQWHLTLLDCDRAYR
ncbi:hypothetical protein KF840_00835 [bacterium]|nr:hypothetical protein [bacterium]